MKAIVACIMIGICTVSLTNAQDQIVLASGESLVGNVRRITPSFVRFVPTSGKVETLDADQVDNIYSQYGNNHFFKSRKLVATNLSSPASVSQLLILAAPGKIKVYRSIPVNNLLTTSVYRSAAVVITYIEKDDFGLIPISEARGFFTSNIAKSIGEITTEISNLFSDNADLKKRFDADKKNAKARVILNYVKEYNEWSQRKL